MARAGVTSSLLKRVNTTNNRLETVVTLAELAKEAGVSLELNRETIKELEMYIASHEQSDCEDVCGCFVEMVEEVKKLVDTPPDSIEELFEATSKVASLRGIEQVILSQLTSRSAIVTKVLGMINDEDGYMGLERLLEVEYGVAAQVVMAGSDKAMALQAITDVCRDGYPFSLEDYFKVQGAEVMVIASQHKLYPWIVALKDAIYHGNLESFKVLLKEAGWSLHKLPQKPKEYTTVAGDK